MIKNFLKETSSNDEFNMRERIVCQDGFSMSIQASKFHYCSPRKNLTNGNYDSVEIGFPNEYESLLIEYAEDPNHPIDTVYGYVPVKIVNDVIEKHGGMSKSN